MPICEGGCECGGVSVCVTSCYLGGSVFEYEVTSWVPPTEAAVGVAEDALEISEAVRAPRTEGDAGLR